MIKKMFSNKNFKIHVIVWVIYTVYYSLIVKFFYHTSISTSLIFQSISYRIAEILLFYTNAYFVFGKYTDLKKVFPLIMIFISSIAWFILYFYILEFYIFPYFKISVINAKPILEQVLSRSIVQGSNFIIYALGYSFALRVIQQQIEIGKEKDRNALLEKEKAQSEYTFLRSQINPHFMFNTLNMIYDHVRKVPGGVGDTVIQFADMMRYATSKTMQQDEVGLKEELQFVDDFIDIQKKRFKDALLIDYTKEGNVQSQRIVPMVLFTFVENAIKHGQNDDPEFPLFIRMTLIKERFTFTVHNKKNLEPHGFDTGETGICLISLRKRLDSVYKNGGYSLTIDDWEEEFIVSFIVNFNEVKK
jgi:two-component system, LytTR family, sensor kinase